MQVFPATAWRAALRLLRSTRGTPHVNFLGWLGWATARSSPSPIAGVPLPCASYNYGVVRDVGACDGVGSMLAGADSVRASSLRRCVCPDEGMQATCPLIAFVTRGD